MTEMIDRVAAVLGQYFWRQDSDAGTDAGQRLHIRTAAKAVIEAMREPTEDMINACDINIPTTGMITGVWGDMIDAILETR